MSDILEINAVTGERIERDFTQEELEQRQKDIANHKAQIASQEEEKNAKIAAKESAIQKLSALGLNEEEINAIIGGIQ
jgi:hypothetical protein